MKKILLSLIITIATATVWAQQTAWPTSAPPGSVSSPTTPRNNGTADSLNTKFYLGVGQYFNQFYTAAQVNAKILQQGSPSATNYGAFYNVSGQLFKSSVFLTDNSTYASIIKPFYANLGITANGINLSAPPSYLSTNKHISIDGSGNFKLDTTSFLGKYLRDTIYNPLMVSQSGGAYSTYGVNGITSTGVLNLNAVAINEQGAYFQFYDNLGNLLALFGNGSSSNVSFFPHLQVIDKPVSPNDVARIRDIDSLLTGYTPTGSNNYIQNNTSVTPQSASFNINENGYLGDSLKTYSERIKGGLSVGDTSITSQDTSFYYGYSVTAGQVSTAIPLRWTTIVSSKTNVFEVNRGVSGTTLQLVTAGDSSLQDRMPNMPVYRKTFKYLFIEEGINDCDLGLSLITYEPEYETILNYLKTTKGWPANRIIVLTPNVIGLNSFGKNNSNLLPFAAANIQAAKATGVQYVDVNKYELQFGQKGVLINGADSIHPTNYGHAIEAQAILDRIGRGRFNEGVDVNGGYFELGANVVTYGTVNFGRSLYGVNHTVIRINDATAANLQVGIDYNSTNGQTSINNRNGGNMVFGSGLAGTLTPSASSFYFDGSNNYYPIGKYGALISYGNAFTGNEFLAVDGGSTTSRSGIGYEASTGQTVFFGRGGINGGLMLGLNADATTMTTSNSAAYIDASNKFNFNGIDGTFNFGTYSGDAIQFQGDIAGYGYQSGTGYSTLFGRSLGLFFTTGQASSTTTASNSAGGVISNNFFFNGTPTAPTATPGTNTTQIATMAAVVNRNSVIGQTGTIANTMIYNTPTATTPTTDTIGVKESGKWYGATTAAIGLVKTSAANTFTANQTLASGYSWIFANGSYTNTLATNTLGNNVSTFLPAQGGTLAVARSVISSSSNQVTPTLLATDDYNYQPTSASLVTILLPPICAVGARIYVTGTAAGTGGWKITQNAGDVIKASGSTTTVGTAGYIASANQYNSILLVCVVANTGSGGTYVVQSVQGTPTYN